MPRAEAPVEVGQVGATDARWDAGEAELHHLGAQPQGLDDLGPAVAELTQEMPIFAMTLRSRIPAWR